MLVVVMVAVLLMMIVMPTMPSQFCLMGTAFQNSKTRIFRTYQRWI